MTDEGRLFFLSYGEHPVATDGVGGGRVHWLSIEYSTLASFLAKNNHLVCFLVCLWISG